MKNAINAADTPEAFQKAAKTYRQGEVLFMVDRNLSAETIKQIKDFIAQSGLACKTSAAYFGMYYDLEPVDLAAPVASTGHHWDTSNEALPALDSLSRAYRRGTYQKPLHVIFIGTDHTMGNIEDSSQFGYAQTARNELKQIAVRHADVAFSAVISKDTTRAQVKHRIAQTPHPLPLHHAGHNNKDLHKALRTLLAPHIQAQMQKQREAGTEAAENISKGLQKDLKIMKPLRIQKRP